MSDDGRHIAELVSAQIIPRVEALETGGATAVGCVFVRTTAVDVSQPGSNIVGWEVIWDNTYDQNVIDEPPDGFGISLEFGELVVNEAGVWAFAMHIEIPNDPDILFRLEPWFPAGILEDTHGPGVFGHTVQGDNYVARISDTLVLPAGVTLDSLVRTYTAASVSPLNTVFGGALLNMVRVG